MKKHVTTLTMTVFLFAGCGGNKQSTDDIATVDVTKSYSKKELVLQDILEVEYIPLETNDEFLCQGFVQAVGKDFILVRNRINDGNIFVFDRNGKGLKKINRKGNGGEEYTFLLEIALDEDRSEIFVNDHMTRRVLVYDLDGNFRRSFKHKDGAMYNGIYNFDRENLICNDSYVNDQGIANERSIMIVSKLDGSITKEVQIPFKEKKSTWLIVNDVENNTVHSSSPRNHFPIIPHFGNWIITEPSADTLYIYTPDHNMTPLIVRTPSVQSMNPEVFLFPGALTDSYYFMQAVKKEYDFVANKGYPGTNIAYDISEKTIFEYIVSNADYSDKRPVNMTSKFISNSIAFWQILDSHMLVEDYNKGQLNGRLKEIAEILDEESNPVIVLAKHKE